MSTPNQVPSTPILEDLLRIRGQEGNGGSDSTPTNAVENILKTASLEDTSDTEVKQSLQEMHQDRMFVLREQLKFFRETEWRYKPIEVLIGCLAVNTRFP